MDHWTAAYFLYYLDEMENLHLATEVAPHKKVRLLSDQ